MTNLIDITGKKFNRWTVIEYAFTKKGIVFWKCICECGTESNIRSQDLRTGHSKSCGCIHTQKYCSLEDNLNKNTKWNGKCLEWTGALTSAGYGWFGFKSKGYSSHRVAYELAHGKISKGLFVRHICHNPKCCNSQHLVLGTCQDNSNDCTAAGRQNKGSEVNTSKLKKYQVLAIRKEHAEGSISLIELAKKYNVKPTSIGAIVRREAWKHI